AACKRKRYCGGVRRERRRAPRTRVQRVAGLELARGCRPHADRAVEVARQQSLAVGGEGQGNGLQALWVWPERNLDLGCGRVVDAQHTVGILDGEQLAIRAEGDQLGAARAESGEKAASELRAQSSPYTSFVHVPQ